MHTSRLEEHPFESQNLVQLLWSRAKAHPNDTALIFLGNGASETDRLTYSLLADRVHLLATDLPNHISPGDRALLVYPAGLEFIVAFFACLYAGVIPVPVAAPHGKRRSPALDAIIGDARPKLVMTEDTLLGSTTDYLAQFFNRKAAKLKARSTNGTPGEQFETQTLEKKTIYSDETLRDIQSSDTAYLQYTSGSSGNPKGAIVSHANLMSNQQAIRYLFNHDEKITVVSWLPHYHDMGLVGSILQPLYLGGRCILMSPLHFLQRPLRWLQCISKYDADTSGAPNFAYDYCCDRIPRDDRGDISLSDWKVAFNGSEPVRPETLTRFADEFAASGFKKHAFLPCYGMAESTLIITGSNAMSEYRTLHADAEALENNRFEIGQEGADTRAIVSCGKTAPEHEVRICDPGSAEILPNGKIGEITFTGPSVTAGYWNDEGSSGCDTNAGDTSILRTGDLGFLHEGELYVTGRKKDIIIVRGRNHYPQDLERTAEQSHASIADHGTAAIQLSPEKNEELVILVELKREFLRSVQEMDVVDCVREAIADTHGLQVSHVVLLRPRAIPRTTSGKVKRSESVRRFLEDAFDSL